MGVLHSTHAMQQASKKWFSQVSSGVDAVVHARHAVRSFLSFDDPHNSVFLDC
jgi:hypothetical protein